MKKSFDANGVPLPEFVKATSPILRDLRKEVVNLMDAGYSASDIYYYITSDMSHIINYENVKRYIANRRKAGLPIKGEQK